MHTTLLSSGGTGHAQKQTLVSGKLILQMFLKLNGMENLGVQFQLNQVRQQISIFYGFNPIWNIQSRFTQVGLQMNEKPLITVKRLKIHYNNAFQAVH